MLYPRMTLRFQTKSWVITAKSGMPRLFHQEPFAEQILVGLFNFLHCNTLPRINPKDGPFFHTHQHYRGILIRTRRHSGYHSWYVGWLIKFPRFLIRIICMKFGSAIYLMKVIKIRIFEKRGNKHRVSGL